MKQSCHLKTYLYNCAIPFQLPSIFIHPLTMLTLYTDFKIAEPFYVDVPLNSGFEDLSAI